MIPIRAKELIAILMILAATLPAYTALETNVLLVKSYNLSVDLDPGFSILGGIAGPGSQASAPIQAINIYNSKNPQKNATISVFSMYFPAKSANFWAITGSEMVNSTKSSGYTEVEKQYTTTSDGQNAIIHVLNSATGSSLYLAVVGIDKLNGVMIMSDLDLNNTTRIIKTLKIKP
jgi:hypothetical protein